MAFDGIVTKITMLEDRDQIELELRPRDKSRLIEVFYMNILGLEGYCPKVGDQLWGSDGKVYVGDKPRFIRKNYVFLERRQKNATNE